MGMKITPWRRKQLQRYHRLNTGGLSLGRLLDRKILILLLALCVIVFGLSVAFAMMTGIWEVCFLAAGLIVGRISSDLRALQESQRIWSLLEHIIDWNRVETLLNDAV